MKPATNEPRSDAKFDPGGALVGCFGAGVVVELGFELATAYSTSPMSSSCTAYPAAFIEYVQYFAIGEARTPFLLSVFAVGLPPLMSSVAATLRAR